MRRTDLPLGRHPCLELRGSTCSATLGRPRNPKKAYVYAVWVHSALGSFAQRRSPTSIWAGEVPAVKWFNLKDKMNPKRCYGSYYHSIRV